MESSFDDSCAGIVSSCGQVLANEKMTADHNTKGENAPLKVEQHHRSSLPIVVKEAMEKANLTSLRDLEAIAVTIGPGQTPSLNAGISFAT